MVEQWTHKPLDVGSNPTLATFPFKINSIMNPHSNMYNSVCDKYYICLGGVMEIVSMTCRNCGGKLEISKDSEQILCLHCGTEYLVSYKDSGVSLRLLSEGIKRIQESTDKTAAELALARIRAEKENLRHVIKTRVWDRMKYEDLTIYTVNEVGEPSSLHKILEKVLHDMEASSFPFREPKSKIEKVKQYLDISAELVAKYDELRDQEEYHLSILRN